MLIFLLICVCVSVVCFIECLALISHYDSSAVRSFAKLQKFSFFLDSWDFVNFAKPPMSEVECEDHL